MSGAIDAYLVAGGPYHDIDLARLEVLKLLAEHESVRTRIGESYADVETIAASRVLVTYTCDLVPNDGEIAGLERFLAAGGHWFALHGTNSALRMNGDAPITCPPLPAAFRHMLGSQFMAHPPIGRYKVTNAAPEHPLVAGIGPFHVEDEHYLQDHEPGNLPLLVTRFSGRAGLFERAEWPEGEHQVMYLREVGGGQVLYLSLGHARGRFDMRPLQERYPFVERGAWTLPVYYELLRRGLRWALEG